MYLFGCLESVLNRHLNVHQNQLVHFAMPPNEFIYHCHSLVPVKSTIGLQVLTLKHCFQGKMVEGYVIDDQYPATLK
jgi:hypothetical protein